MTTSEGSGGEHGVSPLASVEPWDLVADGYTAELVPWGEHFAGVALELADLDEGDPVADIACGPGTLALLAAARGARVSALDHSPAMIAHLRRRADEAGLTLEDVRIGDGQDLPWDDASFEAAFSMVGLIFFPDRAAGFREMRRVLRPGGRAVVSSIAELPEPAMEVFGAIAELLPGLLDRQGRAPLAEPGDFEDEMSAAGFRGVRVETVSHALAPISTTAFWERMERSAAPFVLLRRRLGEDRWRALSDGVLARLRDAHGDGPLEEVYVEHLGIGTA